MLILWDFNSNTQLANLLIFFLVISLPELDSIIILCYFMSITLYTPLHW